MSRTLELRASFEVRTRTGSSFAPHFCAPTGVSGFPLKWSIRSLIPGDWHLVSAVFAAELRVPVGATVGLQNRMCKCRVWRINAHRTTNTKRNLPPKLIEERSGRVAQRKSITARLAAGAAVALGLVNVLAHQNIQIHEHEICKAQIHSPG